ncbi:hypothetical protein EJV47_11785 [Hymenobacter gummosus]|uniref:DUF6603 domain-containing protein n=1 Tax=Hymenobacter gummosus TaxID=1776032 RepID=A0A3S0H7B6_9BACT|nr:DUF6603 domain-containing protein [Hymenobacter gummosus]RTQ50298.1 hypothetical protein EJV47_11785 [Hymenobacter gummosus]
MSSLSLATFKQLLADAQQAGAFSLDLTQLQSAAVSQLAQDYLPAQPLQLAAPVTVSTAADGAQVTVSGTGTAGWLAKAGVTAQFTYADNADVALQLTVTAPEGWSFGAGFPTLQGTVLENFAFVAGQPSVLQLASAALDAGLTFTAALDLQKLSGGLAELLGLSNQTFTGFFRCAKNGTAIQQVELDSPVIAQTDLKIFAVQDTSFKVGSNITYDFLAKETHAVPYVVFATSIPFSAQGQQHTLPLTATVYDFGRSLRFEADVTGVASAALDEIVALAKNFPVDIPSVVPPDFHLEDVLQFRGFFFDIDFSNPNKLALIGFDIGSASPWTLLHLSAAKQDIALTNVLLQFRLNDPLGAKLPWASLGGDIVLGQAGVIEAGATYPEFSVHGGLKDEALLHFSELLGSLLGPSTAELPLIDVTTLNFAFAKGNYAFDAEVEGYMPLGSLPLAIEDIRFGVAYTPEKLTGVLAGIINVAGVDVLLSATYAGAGLGWQFLGATGTGQAIPIGTLMKDVADRFGVGEDLPPALTGLTVDNVTVTLDTKTNDSTFSCELQFPVQGQTTVDLTLDIALTHVDGKFEKTFKGRLTLAGRQFDLDFSTGGTDTIFWGDYENTAGQELAVSDLLRLLLPADDSLLTETQDLRFNLKDAFAGYLKGTDEGAVAKWLLGLDMEFGADLTALPLVGQYIPKDEALRLVFQPRIATQEFLQADVTALKDLLGDAAIVLPDAFSKGLLLQIELSLGTVVIPMALPIGLKQGQLADDPTKAPAPPAGTTPAPAEKATWFNLQKSFGPLQLQRVGVQYESGLLTFLLDGGFSVAGLTVSLVGLSASAQLHPFALSFGLQGLGIEFKSGPVEIGGAFLAKHYTDSQGNPYTEYSGAVQIKAEEFSLAAVGAYANYEGHPSMFVYGVLDVPLGGPAFFFVTGLAAGFGFNRALQVPGIDKVAQFPLVSLAAGGAGAAKPSLATMLEQLHSYIPPAVGEYFLAVGIKFTSFKLIDSFALLVVSFGSDFELDLLGLSTLVLPAQTGGAVPPLAEVQMALKASFVPAIGFVGVEAKLTSASFLFSRDCHLTGGFAFYCWFAGPHQDDFAVTLGGYHPSYQRPAHFPVVDKLGFNWVITSQLSIKGDAYFALVPSAVMAGTHLSAVWEDGSLRAWFNAGADFIIAWKPYHYDASMYVDMGVSYTYHFFGTHHISVDVGADLHIWGPEFAGKAHVHLWIVTFDVRFGSSSSQQPSPISWPEFSQSFLPDHNTVCSLAVQRGLVKKDGDGADAHPVVNPKDMVLGFNSLVPLKSAKQQTAAQTTADLSLNGAATNWGVGPMGLPAVLVGSEAVVTVKRGNDYVTEGLRLEPVTKGVPVGLWGQSVSPAINGARLIDGAACGFTISCSPPKEPAETAFIDRAELELEPEDISSPAWQWSTMPAFNATAAEQQFNAPSQETARRDYLRTHLETLQAGRAELLRQLGFTAPIFPDKSLADAFVVAPQFAEALS